jgi:hypothetical protein
MCGKRPLVQNCFLELPGQPAYSGCPIHSCGLSCLTDPAPIQQQRLCQLVPGFLILIIASKNRQFHHKQFV